MSINTNYINALADQIRNTGDCDTLLLLITQHIASVTGLAASIASVRADILSKILPIMTLPSPTPQDIVDWIAKLITATAGPQLQATIEYALQLIQLAAALNNLREAVEHAIANIDCGIDFDPTDIISSEKAVALAIDAAFGDIASTIANLETVTGETLPVIDTSSQAAFIASAASNSSALYAALDDSLT